MSKHTKKGSNNARGISHLTYAAPTVPTRVPSQAHDRLTGCVVIPLSHVRETSFGE